MVLEPVDLLHLGSDRTIGVYPLETDDGLALFDCGPSVCCEALETGLAARGLALEDVRHLLLSHIHLDHAGAAGTLVRRLPHLQVHVSEIGAPHLSQQGDFASIDRIAAREPVPSVARYWGELGAFDTARELGVLGLAGDLCVDGSIGSHTSAMREPYADRATTGHAYLTVEELRAHVVGCTRHGLQAGFHVIGDRANDLVREALHGAAEEVGRAAIRAAGHRMEHLEMPDAAGLALLADLGVSASVQPAFDAEWGGPDGVYARRLGIERAVAMNPFRSMVDAGLRLAFGSDSPVTPLAPWAGVRAAATHRTPAQRLTVHEAFDAHTAGGWAVAGRPGAGRLVIGAPATYAVWDVPAGLGPEGLPRSDEADEPRCTSTVVAGRTIFASTRLSQED